MIKSNNQHFGYLVDGKFVSSKAEAIALAGSVDKVNLYFLNQEWKDYDWSVEPTKSFQQLVDEQCHRIRAQYNWVALLFSGGYDSVTILNGFLRNNLRIDEFIFWDREWETVSLTETQYAVSFAHDLQKTVWPNLKLTFYKRTIKSVVDFYRRYREDWINHPGEQLGLTKNIRDLEFEVFGEILGAHQRSRRIVVEGRDKPRLDLYDNKWYMMMTDGLLKWCMGNSALQFFYDPNFPEIHAKQCYMMIDWLEENFDVTPELVHKIQGHAIGGTIYAQWNLAVGRDPVFHDIPKYGQGIKKISAGGYLCPDSRFIEDHIKSIAPDSYNIWASGIDEIKREWASSWDDTRNEFRTVCGDKHYMRDFDPLRRKAKCLHIKD